MAARRDPKSFFMGTMDSGYLPPGYSDWTQNQLKRVGHFLIEFAVHYRSSKRGES